MNTENANFKTHAEHVAEVLSRWSVQDLIEQTDDDLARADELFYKAKSEITVLEEGTTNYIRHWLIESGGNEYHVRRFQNYCWCSCRDFFYRRRACKHISVSAGVLCANCHELSARVGKYCRSCDLIMHPFGVPQPAAQAAISR